METSPLICSEANQWTGFYKITASVMKELKLEISVSVRNYSLIHTI